MMDFDITAPDKAIDLFSSNGQGWRPECTVTLEGMHKRDLRSRATTKKVFYKASVVVVQEGKGRSISGHSPKGSFFVVK